MNKKVLEYYQEENKKLLKLQEKAQQRKKQLFFARLVSFLFAIFLPPLLFFETNAMIIGVAVGMSVFLFFVRRDYLLEIHLKKTQAGIDALTNEINAHEKSIFSNYNGERFKNNNHAYSTDLHIFGENSLYHFINRTFTLKGENQLAQWLLSPSPDNEITEKQEAIKELASKPELLLYLLTLTEFNKKYKTSESVHLLETHSANFFSRLRKIRFLCFFLSFVNITVFILWGTGYLNYMILILAVFFNGFLVYGLSGKLLNQAFAKSANISDQLRFFEEFILIFEENKFKSQLLNTLSQKFIVSGEKGSTIIYKIRKALKRIDYRLNLVIQLTVNSWLFTDIWFLFHFETIKKKYHKNIEEWFSIIGHLEALTSLSVMQFNQNWIFPVINENETGFYAEEFGHPLISNEKRILNTVKMTGEKKVLIVTGSNMSGKSTLLRSIGVNMVLAFAGAPVCAKSFISKNFKLITYMTINDSLLENISTFQAELMRIKQILEATRQYDDVFVLLDELLRGTNTKDRELGCRAIVTQLIHDKVPAVIATHDLNLTTIEHRYPEKVENFHFDIQIEGKNMFFDYKLKEGICNNFNASLMLKELGLNLDAIDSFKLVE